MTTSFEVFVAEHQARLFGSLCLVTGDRFEAEEIAQEAFVRVLERWGRVVGMENPAGYLFRVSMNVFRTRRRRAALALRRAVVAYGRGMAWLDDRTLLIKGPKSG